MSPADVIRRFVTALERAAVPYMLTGSHASSLHGSPRSTFDLDFVISPTRGQILGLVTQLKSAGCYVDEGAALEALNSYGQFNAIDLDSGWKADFMIRKPRPFSQVEFDRRQPAELEGVALTLATAEDVLIAKLEWAKLGASSRQIEDAAGILRTRAGKLDLRYIETWVAELGLVEEWEAARRLADAPA